MSVRRFHRSVPPLFLAALLGWPGSHASAQTFGFTPTALDIDATRNLVAETTMINSTSTPAQFTVTAKVWRVVGGVPVLEDTRDLIVNPTTFTVKPGASQLLRVGVRKKPGATELSYRIVLQQQPIDGVALPRVSTRLGTGSTADLNLTLSFSLPVYVTQPGARAQVRFSAAPSGQNLLLRVENAGQRRAIYRNVTLTRGAQTQSLQIIPALAGSTLEFPLTGFASASGPLTLKATGEDGRSLVETISRP